MFGRRNRDDEDPFAALKQSGTYDSAPTSIPTSPKPAAKSRRRATRGSRGGGYLIGLGLIAPLVVVILIVASIDMGSTVSTVSTPGFSDPGISANNPSSGHHVITTTLRPASYLTTAGLTAGLASIQRTAPGSKLILLRVDSTSVDAFVSKRGGGTEEITLQASGSFVYRTPAPPFHPLSFSAIHPAVLPRLILALERRFHVRGGQLSYVTAERFPDTPPSWWLYLADGRDYRASLSGSDLQKMP